MANVEDSPEAVPAGGSTRPRRRAAVLAAIKRKSLIEDDRLDLSDSMEGIDMSGDDGEEDFDPGNQSGTKESDVSMNDGAEAELGITA